MIRWARTQIRSSIAPRPSVKPRRDGLREDIQAEEAPRQEAQHEQALAPVVPDEDRRPFVVLRTAQICRRLPW